MSTVKNTTETTLQPVNGVNVQGLYDTIEAVKADPEIAAFHFRADSRWLGGAHCRSTIKDFYGAKQEDTTRTAAYVFDADEPPVLLGNDAGANPVEYVLHALAACLTTSMVYHAAARGIRLESVEAKLEGDIDLRGFLALSPEIRNGYQQIRVTFKVKGDAPRETLEELVRLAQRRSPVFDTIAHPVDVRVRLADE